MIISKFVISIFTFVLLLSCFCSSLTCKFGTNHSTSALNIDKDVMNVPLLAIWIRLTSSFMFAHPIVIVPVFSSTFQITNERINPATYNAVIYLLEWEHGCLLKCRPVWYSFQVLLRCA